MSLINSSYFIGPLTIAQLGQPAVENNLNLFINRAEPQLLEAALGYDLWQDFNTGLQQSVIDPKWLALRDGVTFKGVSSWPGWYWGFTWFNRYYFLNSQRSIHFPGLAAPMSFTTPVIAVPQIVLIAGNPTGNPTASVPNPIPNTNAYTWSGLANATYSIERRGTGTMIPGVDYSLSNNNQIITLLKSGDVFGAGEIFILKFTQSIMTGSPSSSYVSPIAGYVYYNWVRDQQTMNTGSGVVKAKPENADRWNPSQRMADAWAQMALDIFKMWQFLESQWYLDPTIYPSYDRTTIDYAFFQPINIFNI
jgi:hypothetical protein